MIRACRRCLSFNSDINSAVVICLWPVSLSVCVHLGDFVGCLPTTFACKLSTDCLLSKLAKDDLPEEKKEATLVDSLQRHTERQWWQRTTTTTIMMMMVMAVVMLMAYWPPHWRFLCVSFKKSSFPLSLSLFLFLIFFTQLLFYCIICTVNLIQLPRSPLPPLPLPPIARQTVFKF